MGDEDIFILKLDALGNFIWAKTIGGTGGDMSEDITTDSQGNLYLTGSYESVVDFDPGSNIYNLSSTLMEDIFVLNLDESGNLIFAITVGGIGDVEPDDEGYSIAVDLNGNIYTTGYFSGLADFDPSSNIFNLSSSDDDIFILKMSPLISNLADQKVSNNIILYPNPTSNLITIQSENSLNNKFKVFDQQGREVMKGKLKGVSTEVSLGEISRGTYTIQVEGNCKPKLIVKE